MSAPERSAALSVFRGAKAELANHRDAECLTHLMAALGLLVTTIHEHN